MNRERVEQALNEKYNIDMDDQLSEMVDIMLDAIEWMGQDEGAKDLEDSAKALALMGECGIDIKPLECLMCDDKGMVSSAELAGAVPFDMGKADMPCPKCSEVVSGVKLSSIKDVHVTTGNLILCPSCKGKGCTGCYARGVVEVISNTPSA